MDRTNVLRAASAGALALVSAALLTAAGCNVLANAMYIVKGMNVAAECKLLDGKRIAVVCRPVSSLQYRNSGVARDLGAMIRTTFRQPAPTEMGVSEAQEIVSNALRSAPSS